MHISEGDVGPVMKEEEFVLFRTLITKKFGIVIKGNKRQSLQMKLGHRLADLGIASYRDYYNLILAEPSGEELLTVVSHATNNETYFKRELGRVDVFNAVLRDIRKNKRGRNRNRIRVLSAGCASGEEAYTLNILMRESGLFSWGWDLGVTGIDINRTSLKKAEAAVYTANSFRKMKGSEEFPGKYFDEEGGLYTLKAPYRSSVHFTYGNLIDPGSFDSIEQSDMIFCRNVFLYMTASAITYAAENLYRILDGDGYLWIGVTETLRNKTDLFIPEDRGGVIVYRKNPLPAS